VEEQEKPKKIKKILKKQYVLGFAAFLCCLVVIGGLNKPHFSPFSATVELKNPTSVAVSEDGGVLVDTENRRMLIYSDENIVSAIMETSLSGSVIDKVEKVTISDGYIYVIGSSHYNQGIYLSSESAEVYDLKGNHVKTLTSRLYGEDEYINNPTFKNITVDNGKVYIACADGKEVSVISLGETEEIIGTWSIPEQVFTAAYTPDQNILVVVGMSKNGYSVDISSKEISNMDLAGLISIYLEMNGLDSSEFDLEELEGYCCVPTIALDSSGVSHYLVFTNSVSGESVVYTNDGQNISFFSESTYSAGLFLYNLLFYIALTLLACGAAVALVWLFVKKISSRGRIVTVIIGGIILTSVFYTMQMRLSSEDGYKWYLISQTKQAGYILTNDLGDKLKDLQQEGIQEYCSNPENQDTIQKVYDSLKAISDSNGVEYSTLISIFILDENGQPYTFVNSRNNRLPGQLVYFSEDVQDLLNGIGKNEICLYDSPYETLMYSYDYIYNSEGEKVGIVSVAAYLGNLNYLQSQKAINLSVTLTALMIGIYTAVSAFRTFVNDFKRRKKRDKNDIDGRTVDMAGIMVFVTCLVQSLDSVVIVYVSESLCVGVDPALQAVLVALPLAAVTFGMLIGNLIAEVFIRKLGERLSAVTCSVVTLLSMLCCVFAIEQSNIFVFIIAKLVMSIFMDGVMYIQLDTMPFKSKDDEARQSALNSVIKSSAAASIISMLLTGFISEFLSYSMVYLIGAIMSAIVLVISVLVFRNTNNRQEKQVKKEKRCDSVKYWSIFLKKPMLMFLIFYIVPTMLVGGYKSYLFPLYSSGAGISALLLSNISVFVTALCYITNDQLHSFSQKHNQKVMLIVPKMVLCFGLICFFISPNIYWAIIMLFVVEIIHRMTLVGYKMYIAKVADSNKLDSKRVQSNFYTVNTVLYGFQSPILSSIVGLGMNLACSVVGIIAGALFTVFAFFIRKQPVDKSDS